MSSALIIYCWNIKPSPSLFLPISLTRMSGCPLFHREIDSWVVPIPKDLQRRHEYRTRSTAPPPTLLSGPIIKHLQGGALFAGERWRTCPAPPHLHGFRVSSFLIIDCAVCGESCSGR
ncbi:hypothetical protein DTO282F9_1655 [Paecilomyces variotii]|nr:hypothetical protein DTO282F9_1655 [Paecilomyces variotii]